MIVILDTNILLSAIIWGGNLEKILPLVRSKYLTLAFSKDTLEEISEKIDHFANLMPENKFKLQRYKILLRNLGKFFPIRKSVKICRDPDDDKFLELAITSKAKYLVTGDKDLLILDKFKTTKIVSPQIFLEAIKSLYEN